MRSRAAFQLVAVVAFASVSIAIGAGALYFAARQPASHAAQAVARSYEDALARSGWHREKDGVRSRALLDRTYFVSVAGPDDAGDIHVTATADDDLPSSLLLARC